MQPASMSSSSSEPVNPLTISTAAFFNWTKNKDQRTSSLPTSLWRVTQTIQRSKPHPYHHSSSSFSPPKSYPHENRINDIRLMHSTFYRNLGKIFEKKKKEKKKEEAEAGSDLRGRRWQEGDQFLEFGRHWRPIFSPFFADGGSFVGPKPQPALLPGAATPTLVKWLFYP